MSNQIFSYTNHSRFDTPEIFVSGNNDMITNLNGTTYVDCNSGLWNVNFGYNNSAYKITIPDLQFYPTHFWSSTEATELAAKQICDYFGYKRVFFGHSGSDAIDTAIYISKYTNGKSSIIAYKDGYHGSTVQADVYNCYNTLIDAIDNNTSAVIVEPIMVTKGVIEFDTVVLQRLFELKKYYKFNIIFDETVTALGRADYSFDWKPDILIASKGLTNGVFPLSAVLVNQEISNYIKNTNKVFSHGYTMSGHPIACNMLSKTIDLVHGIDIKAHANNFVELFQSKNLDFVNKGMIFGIRVKDGIAMKRYLQKEGYLIRQSNNVLIFMPMFTSKLENYFRFVDLLTTFQVCDQQL
jgi:adenosylmethionine-8-amino-7-oxononanoate aminotransferase